VKGRSENIRVVSIVDRYLEHARVFHFENAGAPEYLLASADWMPRNLDRRVEIAFPVLAPDLQDRIREILEIQLADTVKGRRMLADGTWARIRPEHDPALRSQDWLYEAATRAGAERVAGHCSGPLSPPSSCHGSAATGTGRPWRYLPKRGGSRVIRRSWISPGGPNSQGSSATPPPNRLAPRIGTLWRNALTVGSE
jgi:hypothetical protein